MLTHPSAPSTQATTLVVLDPHIKDLDTLRQGIGQQHQQQTIVLELHPQRDGVQQITQALRQHPSIRDVHLFAHGAPGRLVLGNTELNLQTVDRYAADLQTWFTPAAESPNTLVLYGCHVAAGDAGTEFLDKLHKYTGANLAASSTLVGNPTLGGSWHLKCHQGSGRVHSILNWHTQQTYSGIFAIKLNDTLPPEGDVLSFEVSPDGRYVVYRADQDSSNVPELYSVPIGSGTPIKLNSPLLPDQYVASKFEVSPDGDQVVYRIAQLTDDDFNYDVVELYSVPVDGGIPVQLNDTLPLGGNIYRFKVSPDSNQVVYYADQDSIDVYELYSVPIDGGTPIKLNAPLSSDGDVIRFEVSPDSSQVVYWANQGSGDVYELYSVPIGGGTPIKLNAPLPSGGDVSHFEISPDGSQVVYEADQDSYQVTELYSVPIGGGTPIKLNDTLTLNKDVFDFEISPDGSRVVYRADQDSNNVSELYSVPIGGGHPIKLNASLPSGGDVYHFEISPDGSQVVYTADQDSDEVRELYSVPIIGGTPVKLNDALPVDGIVLDFEISPDSGRAVYQASQDLYSVPIDGGTPIKLHDALISGRSTSGFYVSPDGSQVVYQTSDSNNRYRRELYSVPIVGGTAIKLNGTLIPGGNVSEFDISPDGNRVVYQADQEVDSVFELYSQALLPAIRVADIVVREGDVGTTRADFTLVLSQSTDNDVTLDYRTVGDTATANNDFRPISGTLTIAAGQTTATLSVEVMADTDGEPDEVFSLMLSNPTYAALVNEVSTATIRNDDPLGRLSISDATIREGDSGKRSAVFTVSRSFPATQDTTVIYSTQDVTAQAGQDYTAATETLTIAAGETTATITIDVLGDTLAEPDETFTVTLSDPINAVLRRDVTGVGTIRNDGDRRFVGTPRADRIRGTGKNDRILGRGGRDRLIGAGRHDTILGGSGKDRLLGKDGKDTLKGQGGHDILLGHAGHDRLVGGKGNDTLKGGSGNDRLIGGKGNDSIITGAGRDIIVVKRGEGVDRVRDFADGFDKLELGNIRFNQLSIEQRRQHVVISVGDQTLIRLQNIDEALITRNDFV